VSPREPANPQACTVELRGQEQVPHNDPQAGELPWLVGTIGAIGHSVAARTDLDVTAVLTFADDEETVGKACRRIAEHLTERGLSFEIIAVDEDSGDNSHAVLALVREQVPELRVVGSPARERGFAVGAQQARGKALWLLDCGAAMSLLAPFGRAYRFVERGQADAVVVQNRFVVCYRSRCAEVLESVRGRGNAFQTRFARRARAAKLECEVQQLGHATAPIRPWTRWLEAITAARST